MKILLVNLYPDTEAGLKCFTEFNFYIRKIFSLQKEIYDSDLELIIRTKNDLDDFLYEVNSAYLKKESGNTFDHTDIIFLVGSSNLHPWAKKAQKFMTLLRMCVKAKKILFATGDAMQGLIYISASNLEKNINVINGNGNGSKLGDIFKVKKEMINMDINDYFLDNVTGDLYSYNAENEEWYPQGNIGLHHRKTAEEYQTLGKFIVKAPIYRPKHLKELTEIYKARQNESIIYTKKNHIQHWLLKEVDFQFKTQLNGNWDCHSFSFVNLEKSFVVLADSERGPAIIDYGNIIGLHFNVNKIYPHTILILRNFINFSIDIMKSNRINSVKKIMEIHPSAHFILIASKNKKNKKVIVRETIKHTVSEEKIAHVGFSFSKSRMPKTLENNAVMLTLDEVSNTLRKTAKIRTKNSLYCKRNQETPLYNNVKDNLSEFDGTLSKKTIRSLLHPTFSNDYLKEEKNWIPGNLSHSIYNKNLKILKNIHKNSENQTVQNPYFNLKTNNYFNHQYRDEIKNKWLGPAFKLT